MQFETPLWARDVPHWVADSRDLDGALRGERGALDVVELMGADSERGRMLSMAVQRTRARFSSIKLYAPLYVSNACANKCTYCGFRYDNPMPRTTLDQAAITEEAQALARTGIRSVLLVTGEAPAIFGVDDVLRAVGSVRPFFDQVAIEVFPMSERDYARVVSAGATSLTLYQETYDRERYRAVHVAGRKRNFLWRLEAPDRAARAGFEEIGLGALLGLSSDWRREVVWLAHHAEALLASHASLRLTFSFPRMREASGGLAPGSNEVDDAALLHAMSALRIAMPDVGAVLSTREDARFRDWVGPRLATKMSAGSCTSPGGYTSHSSLEQFDIADERSPTVVAEMLEHHGVQVGGYRASQLTVHKPPPPGGC